VLSKGDAAVGQSQPLSNRDAVRRRRSTPRQLTACGYLFCARRRKREQPDCVPDWWLPKIVALATLLVGCGIAIGSRHRR
jgi:hypothetical protein